MNKFLAIFIRGFAMGSADVVPGVSGGTVALVTGIYETLVGAIHNLFVALSLIVRGRFKEGWSKIEFRFLLPLFLGIATALVSMAKLINHAMSEHQQLTWALFLGLMLGSLVVVFRMVSSWNFTTVTQAMMSSALAYHITSLKPFSTTQDSLSFFIAGVIAIVAMILPGISGSFLLLVMGKYVEVIDALHGLSDGLISEFLAVAIPFGAGCITGLALFSGILRYLLKKFKDITFAVLAGLMLGSLHKLWPYRDEISSYEKAGKKIVLEDSPYFPEHWNVEVLYVVGTCIFGFLLVLALDRLGKKRPKTLSMP